MWVLLFVLTMPLHSARERSGGTDWKIFHAADDRLYKATANVRKIRSLRTYEEYEKYIAQQKPCEPKESSDLLERDLGVELGLENLFSSFYPRGGDWSEDNDENNNFFQGFSSSEEDISEKFWKSYETDSVREDGSGDSEPEAAQEGFSDSDSFASQDQTVDDFLTKIKRSTKGEGTTSLRQNVKSQPYSSLRSCVTNDFTNADILKGRRCTNEEVLKAGTYLDENLPLIQVIDVLEDIDKVLKVGKLTPRMERIMEYKQCHPFALGYHEDELGCCPWLYFKVEQWFNRFWATQWPN